LFGPPLVGWDKLEANKMADIEIRAKATVIWSAEARVELFCRFFIMFDAVGCFRPATSGLVPILAVSQSPGRFISIRYYEKQRSKRQEDLSSPPKEAEGNGAVGSPVGACKAPFPQDAGRIFLRTGTLTNSLSRRLKRQGNSLARLIPMRESATTSTFS